MQTWEYAPQFAVRTYAYLLPISYIARAYETIFNVCPPFVLNILFKAFSPADMNTTAGMLSSATQTETFAMHKPLQFLMLRATFALFTSLSELRLVQALQKNYTSLAIPTWIILLSSTGMFHTSPAYLPSTTVMVCFMHSIAEQMEGKMDRAIVWGLICCLATGWPFCGVLFVPLGFQAVCVAYQHGATDSKEKGMDNGGIGAVVNLLMRVMGYIVMIQSVVSVVDYAYYGKIVSPTWNIFVYNTGWGGDGINRDELYGVEDVSYYVKNLILNWNGFAVMGILALPFILIKQIICMVYRKSKSNVKEELSFGRSLAVLLLPAYLWVAVVFSRPHKEERFLFPIYPLLAIGASSVMNLVVDGSGIPSFFQRRFGGEKDRIKLFTMVMMMLPFILLSISRSFLLSDGYTAPLQIFTELHHIIKQDEHRNLNKEGQSLICTGGEWYRFPSSYHLPDEYQLAFLKSSFDGQLPQAFTKFGSREESIEIQGRFNDLNEEEMDRYVDISDCSYVIDMTTGEDSLRENDTSEALAYIQQDDVRWEKVTSTKFLDADRTPSVHRILYLPLIRNASYKQYAIFRREQLMANTRD